MIPSIRFRSGDEHTLAIEYVRMKQSNLLVDKTVDFPNPLLLNSENILAVHYADGGAQGEAGAVRILYYTQNEVQILYGNYIYGNLNLDAIISILPMLKSLDSRYSFNPPLSVWWKA